MLQGRSPGLSSFSSPVESGGAAEEGGRDGSGGKGVVIPPFSPAH